jgi:hypothetical protein
MKPSDCTLFPTTTLPGAYPFSARQYHSLPENPLMIKLLFPGGMRDMAEAALVCGCRVFVLTRQ